MCEKPSYLDNDPLGSSSMTADSGSESVQSLQTYDRNGFGILFSIIFMFLILTTIIYIPELSLHDYAPYDRGIYTSVCALTLVSMPITLILTFAPLETPLIQVVIFLYCLHAAMTVAFFFLIEDALYLALVALMLIADVLMIASLIAGYESSLSRFLPFRRSKEDKSPTP